MKAVVYTEYGLADALQLREVDKPVPRDDEVLIRVHATSVNDWDWGLLQGVPFVNRLIGGLLKPKKRILGSDIAGRIEAVGKGVEQLQPGDEVYGDLSGEWGGFAEYVCAREEFLAKKPERMSFVEAAAIPQAAMLAVQGLVDHGKIQQGQRVLINGAGGGVGTFAIQLARLYGAEVTGVDSAGKLEMLRSLGFDHVIDYAKQDFTRSGRQYDLILDVKTDRSPFAYARALSPGGIYATVGGSTLRILQALVLGPIVALNGKRKIRIVGLKQNKDLAYMNELFQAGKVKPVIDRLYRLEELPEAMQRFAEASHQGKVVITIGPDHSSGEEYAETS